MLLTVERLAGGTESTLGVMRIAGKVRCFTLEDQYREGPKVPGETRIPAGIYDVKLRTEGGFNARYAARDGIKEIHHGMLWLQNVPGFEWILIHCGNTDADTEGCILVGSDAIAHGEGNYALGRSVPAYLDVYPEIASALLRNENVTIEIIDKDRPTQYR